jgi:hypothetical protein
LSVTGLKAYYNFEQTSGRLFNLASNYISPTFNNATIVNGMAANGNRLIASGVTGVSWSSYIRSNDFISTTNGGGELYVTGTFFPPHLAIGFEKSPYNQYPNNVYQNANYGWHTTESINNIYEKTSYYPAIASTSTSQIWKITMDAAGVVKYYVGTDIDNLTLYRTSSVTAASDAYYINASFDSAYASADAYVYLVQKVNQLPNVQDGTIFEETDTNKSYVFTSGSWLQIT